MSMTRTGFSEITEERLAYKASKPWYVEVALTGACNFNCTYCNRFSKEVSINEISRYLGSFSTCRHIQVTGGEPTLHPDFQEIMHLFVGKARVVGLSTNGSANIGVYHDCGAGVFSLSFDDYDHEMLKSRGYVNPEKVERTIKELSLSYYVNVGIVIDSLNVDRIEDIIDHILSLGVTDIKLSTSTKDDVAPEFKKDYPKYPILNYRVERFKRGLRMRGFPASRCLIAKSDVTIVGGYHYPCLVYFREGGDPIGSILGDVEGERSEWAANHAPKLDTICSKYCMDFKCEFNHSLEGNEL